MQFVLCFEGCFSWISSRELGGADERLTISEKSSFSSSVSESSGSSAPLSDLVHSETPLVELTSDELSQHDIGRTFIGRTYDDCTTANAVFLSPYRGCIEYPDGYSRHKRRSKAKRKLAEWARQNSEEKLEGPGQKLEEVGRQKLLVVGRQKLEEVGRQKLVVGRQKLEEGLKKCRTESRTVVKLFDRYISKWEATATPKLMAFYSAMRTGGVMNASLADDNRSDDSLGSSHVVSGTPVEQPKDGSCLFHSIAYGLGDKTGSSTAQLRKDTAAFIAANPSEKIANTSIKDWVEMIAGQTPREYSESLAASNAWGGDLELAIATIIRDINIDVYEAHELSGHFRSIASFGQINRELSASTVSVVYSTKPARHYDALLVDALLVGEEYRTI